MSEPANELPTDEEVVEAARGIYHDLIESHEIYIRDDAKVERDEDDEEGAFVQAWVYIRYDEDGVF